MIRIAVSLLLILSLTTHTGLLATEIVVPVRVSASSNSVSNDLDSLWHVDTLRLGAAHYNSATGSNAPYGLLGFHNRIVGCVTSQHSGTQYPGHESYASESPKHSKPKGMWMSANGDVTDAWVEFELPEETDLGQLWIWNWNDAPEIGRRVKQATIQTSTQTTAADQLGKVTYDVNHHTADFPNIGRKKR